MMKLQRTIGPLGFLLCIISAMIGSGWLLGPFFIAKTAGPAGIISWILGGILMLTIVLSYAELCTSVPLAGGPIRYIQFSHGTAASYILAWISWLGIIATASVETLAVIHYASSYIPSLMYSENGVGLLTSQGFAAAAVVILGFMTFFNSFSAKLFAKTNNYIMAFKLLVPVLTFSYLFLYGFHASNFLDHGFAPMGWKGIISAVSTAGVVFSLMGCHAGLQFAGEVKNPKRNIPLGILLSLVVGIVLYSLLQIAFIGALSPADLAQGWPTFSFAGELSPFVGLTTALGASWLSTILYADAIVSPSGSGFVYVGAGARLGYAMAKNHFIPSSLMKLNKAGIPVRMLIANYCVGIFLFLPFPTWQSMMSFLVSSVIISYSVGPLVLNIIRKNVVPKQESFQAPFPYLLGYLGFYFSNLIALWSGWPVISKTVIAAAIGSLGLVWYKYRKIKNPIPLHFKEAIWLIPYLGGLALISYLSSFSGINWIPIGLDFFVMAIFSLAIYIYAQKKGFNKKAYKEFIQLELTDVL